MATGSTVRQSVIEGRVCTQAGCEAPVYNVTRGLCRNCYARFLHNGSPERLQRPHGSGTLMKCGYLRARDGARAGIREAA